jgi:hypothetical protein
LGEKGDVKWGDKSRFRAETAAAKGGMCLDFSAVPLLQQGRPLAALRAGRPLSGRLGRDRATKDQPGEDCANEGPFTIKVLCREFNLSIGSSWWLNVLTKTKDSEPTINRVRLSSISMKETAGRSNRYELYICQEPFLLSRAGKPKITTTTKYPFIVYVDLYLPECFCWR